MKIKEKIKKWFYYLSSENRYKPISKVHIYKKVDNNWYKDRSYLWLCKDLKNNQICAFISRGRIETDFTGYDKKLEKTYKSYYAVYFWVEGKYELGNRDIYDPNEIMKEIAGTNIWYYDLCKPVNSISVKEYNNLKRINEPCGGDG